MTTKLSLFTQISMNSYLNFNFPPSGDNKVELICSIANISRIPLIKRIMDAKERKSESKQNPKRSSTKEIEINNEPKLCNYIRIGTCF